MRTSDFDRFTFRQLSINTPAARWKATNGRSSVWRPYGTFSRDSCTGGRRLRDRRFRFCRQRIFIIRPGSDVIVQENKPYCSAVISPYNEADIHHRRDQSIIIKIGFRTIDVPSPKTLTKREAEDRKKMARRIRLPCSISFWPASLKTGMTQGMNGSRRWAPSWSCSTGTALSHPD